MPPPSLSFDVEDTAIQVEGTYDFTCLHSFRNQCGRQGSYDEARLVEDAEHHRLVFTFRAMVYKQIHIGTLLKIGNDRMPIDDRFDFGKKDRNLKQVLQRAKRLIFKETVMSNELILAISGNDIF